MAGRASYTTTQSLAPHAKTLRAHFDARFSDPRRSTRDRFVWDYWHVPGQYTALRTPAFEYFPKAAYERFHRALVHYGRTVLGCHDVSPPWMSCYVEGCRQELHGDLPHGPFAFVFSLTNWKKRVFRGGETLLLKDDVLDFWSSFVSVRAVEEQALLHAVPPAFGQLTVFDPRVPHGVRTVTGTNDPREGRLVIHGWFVQPRPFIEGNLHEDAVALMVQAVTERIQPHFAKGLPLAGLLSVRITVRSGQVSSVRVLSDTTRVPMSFEPNRRALVRAALAALRGVRLPVGRGNATVTLPIVFDRE